MSYWDTLNDNEESYYRNNTTSINESYINNYFDDIRERVLQESLSNELLLESDPQQGSMWDSIGSGLATAGDWITKPFRWALQGTGLTNWLKRGSNEANFKAEDVESIYKDLKDKTGEDLNKLLSSKGITEKTWNSIKSAVDSNGKLKSDFDLKSLGSSTGLTGYLQNFGNWLQKPENVKNLMYGGAAVGAALAGFYLIKKFMSRKDKSKGPTPQETQTAQALASGRISVNSPEGKQLAQQMQQYAQNQQRAA